MCARRDEGKHGEHRQRNQETQWECTNPAATGCYGLLRAATGCYGLLPAATGGYRLPPSEPSATL